MNAKMTAFKYIVKKVKKTVIFQLRKPLLCRKHVCHFLDNLDNFPKL